VLRLRLDLDQKQAQGSLLIQALCVYYHSHRLFPPWCVARAVLGIPVGATDVGRGAREGIQDPWPWPAQLEPSWSRGGEAHRLPSSRRWAAGTQLSGQTFSCHREAQNHRTSAHSSIGSNSRYLDPLRRDIYLSKLHSKCFNCLASGYRVASATT
jgi:hypothetical protein